MTVADLIEELKKLPQHYSVLLVTPSTSEEGLPNCDDYWGVDSVNKQSGLGEWGSVVRINGGDL
ncbi:hypothetical protein [Herbaspirillum huttiense]|uniref:Uncharacterized protein n=2 Tax=Herbaspirillum huttiense TaxID=863372 RepID=A0AAJ2H9I1_9BURK|nr:hypothetical protein [Herbaspirillum huttiense]MDR9839437.1 hypothetical protein [Herbaspirillum huttiense]